MNHASYEKSTFAASLDAPPANSFPGHFQPLFLLMLLYVVFFETLAYSATLLPPRIASHFDAAGNPNGWMSRDGHLLFMGLTGLLLPLFMLGISFLVRVLPPQLVNVPHREYWLSAERRAETAAYLARGMTWLACFLLTFFTGLNWLVVEANRHQPVQLSNGIWVMAGAFLAVVLGWSVNLIWHFSQVPANEV